jgi:DNA primase
MGWARKPEVETVYLTEGESDTLALIETGIESDGKAAVVASPGTSFPREWAPLFNGKRVVLCYDLDGAGIAAAATVAATLKGHAAEILRWKGASQ